MTKPPKRYQVPKLHVLRFCALLLVFALPQMGSASPWVIGITGGIGGTGIQKSVDIEGEIVDAARSESPLMMGISIERLLHDRLSLALEHHRGMRMGPFSSGVGFTGLSWRWYLLRDAPSLIGRKAGDYAVVRRWSPFAGFATGVASGTITRERNVVPTVTSSGLFIGTRIGVDYQKKTSMVLRPEISYAFTFSSSPPVQESLSEFGILITALFPL